MQINIYIYYKFEEIIKNYTFLFVWIDFEMNLDITREKYSIWNDRYYGKNKYILYMPLTKGYPLFDKILQY